MMVMMMAMAMAMDIPVKDIEYTSSRSFTNAIRSCPRPIVNFPSGTSENTSETKTGNDEIRIANVGSGGDGAYQVPFVQQKSSGNKYQGHGFRHFEAFEWYHSRVMLAFLRRAHQSCGSINGDGDGDGDGDGEGDGDGLYNSKIESRDECVIMNWCDEEPAN